MKNEQVYTVWRLPINQLPVIIPSSPLPPLPPLPPSNPNQFKNEVHEGTFPTEQYSPYKMSDEEAAIFASLLSADQSERGQAAEATSKKLVQNDEYDVVKLY